MTKTVLILGYGICGKEVGKLLLLRGDKVIVGQRSRPKDLPSEAEYIQVNVLNKDGLIDAVKAKPEISEIVIALGFIYESKVWADIWPKAMSNLIYLGETTGARLVFIDNLYMYGPQSKPLTEDMPLYTGTTLLKPKTRADITRMWMTASQDKRVKFTALRAPDFYGPKCVLSHLGEVVFPNMVQGKAAQFLIPLDNPHDWAYVPDIARAAVLLIDADDDCYGQVWHVPCAPTRTTRDLVKIASEYLGQKNPNIMSIPFWLLGFFGLFSTFMSEVKEMGFTWKIEYYVNSDKFAKKFSFQPTSFEVGVVETVKSFQGTVTATV
jgi:nucleoside-diphosphate-sugar epimerase